METASTGSTITAGSATSTFVPASMSLGDRKSQSSLRSSIKDTNNNKRDPANSTQALFLLAEVTIPLLPIYLNYLK